VAKFLAAQLIDKTLNSGYKLKKSEGVPGCAQIVPVKVKSLQRVPNETKSRTLKPLLIKDLKI